MGFLLMLGAGIIGWKYGAITRKQVVSVNVV